MTPKKLFLILFTAAHQIVFWFLLFLFVAFCRGGSVSAFDRFVERSMIALMSPLVTLSWIRSSAFPFFFKFIANSFLWAVSAWYALAAWRRLRSLPPLEGGS